MRGSGATLLSGYRRIPVLILVVLMIAAGAVLGVLSATAGAQGACPGSNFDEYVGANDGDWSTPLNWAVDGDTTNNAVPTSTEVACGWASGTTVTVDGSDTADSVQAGGDLDIPNGGTLTLASQTDTSQVADLTLDGGGTLDGPGTGTQALTVTGSFDWGGARSGPATLSGSVSLGAGTVAIDGSNSTPTFDGGSVMSTTVTVDGSNFAATGSPSLTASGAITVDGDLGGSGATFIADGVTAGAGVSNMYGFGANELTLTGGSTTVASANTLDAGAVTLQDGTLTVDGGGTLDGSGALSVTGGSVVVSGTVDASSASVSGGTLQDDGTLGSEATVTSTGTLSGTGTVEGAIMNTSGTVSPGDGSSPGELSTTSAYTQGASATLAITINGTAAGSGYSQLDMSDEATLAGTLAVSFGFTPTSADQFQVLASTSVTNTFGTVTGNDGYLPSYASGGVTLAATPSSCPSSNFDVFTATSGDWSDGMNWSTGQVPTTSQIACWGSSITVTVNNGETADSIQAGGTLDIASGGTLDLTSASHNSTVESLSLDGGGELDGASGQTLTVTGSFDWGKTGSGMAKLNAAGGSALAISSGALTIDGTTSTPAFEGGSISTGSSSVSITNTKFETSGAPTLTTTSTITIGAGANITGSGATFTAAGVIAAAGVSGSYGFGSEDLTLTGGTTTVASGNTLDVGTLTLMGGTLQGSGTVGGAVTNTSGMVSPGDGGPGTLTLDGDYSQSSTGTLSIEISGTTPGSGYSQLSVGGTAMLGGDLSVTTNSPFVPVSPDTFAILTSTGALTGTFSTTSASGYLVQYGASGVTLAATPSSCTGSFDAYTAASGSWSDTTKWSTGAPPTSNQVACWGSGTTVTVNDSETADSIQATGSLAITTGTLRLKSPTDQSSVGALTLDGGGALYGTSGQTLTVTGNFDWGGTGSGTSALNAPPGSGLAIDQTGGAGASLTIDGTASAPAFDGGSITTNSPVTISNPNLTDANAPTLAADDGVSFDGVALVSNAMPGTITTTAISNSGTSSVLGFDVDLQTGTAGTLSGALTLASLDTGTGTTLPVASGATLSVENGTIGGVVTGSGTFTGGKSGGTTTIAGSGTLSTGNVDVGSGHLAVDSPAIYDAGTGTTIGSGTLSLATAATTGSLSLTGGGALTDSSGKTLTVTGSFQWTSGKVSPNGGTIATGGTITLGSGATTGGAAGAFSAGGGVVTSGVTGSYGFGPSALALTGGTTAVASGNTLTSGALTLTAGTLQDDGTIVATTTTLAGGTLDGTGTVDGAVTNSSGTVAPGDNAPGVLTVDGSYSQGGDGTLAIDLAGGTPGSGFGELEVSGKVALGGGDLALTDENSFVPGLEDTFKILTSGSVLTGAATLSGPSASLYQVTYDATDVTLSANPVPVNIDAPALTGTPSVGQTLSCSAGTWSADPSSFAYQWNQDGTLIGGANDPTYVVATTDAGHSLTCTVTASNKFGMGSATSPAVSVPAPPTAPNPPFNITAPAISGTPTPGNQLSCTDGTWLNSPSSFAHQWERGASPIAGATAPTYTVQIADEAQTLTCVVTATNAGGAGSPRASNAVVVAEPGTLSCPMPTGKLSGRSLGPFQLGFKRSRARHTVKNVAAAGSGEDDFCLYGGWGIAAGYPSSKLLRTIPKRERGRLSGRIVLALTPNPYYALSGVRPGTALSSVPKPLHLGKAIRIGANSWYVIPGSASNGLLRVRGGIVQEVGIATKAFTSTRAAQRRFLGAFNSA